MPIWALKEIKMNKKMIIGLALAVVLLSGSMFSAYADCGIQLPSVYGCHSSIRDTDRAAMDKGLQGNNDWERDLQSTTYNSY
jgi:hypothetical protein